MIDFEKYLDEEQKKEIAEVAFYDAVKERYKSYDTESILYLLSQDYLTEILNGMIGKDHKNKISEKVTSAIKDLSKYDVFRGDSKYSRESLGHRMLEEIISDKKPYLEERVLQLINNEEVGYFHEAIGDAVNEIVYERLFKQRN